MTDEQRDEQRRDWQRQARAADPAAGDRHEVAPHELDDEDLVRELERIHATRHDTFLHGSTESLVVHSERQRGLEDEYLRRYPGREVDPQRLREGARTR